MNIFVHDFGNVVIGPQFEAAFKDLSDDLQKSHNSKAYKKAKYRQLELENCLSVLASVSWQYGEEVMDVTP